MKGWALFASNLFMGVCWWNVTFQAMSDRKTDLASVAAFLGAISLLNALEWLEDRRR